MNPTHRFVRAAAQSLLTLFILLALTAAAHKPTPKPKEPQVSSPATWDLVDKLIKDQKFEAAATATATLLQAAKAVKSEGEWTKALIRHTQLRVGLHGAETAVRNLQSEPWPQGFESQVLLRLFYAHTLINYLDTYSWEIRKREHVVTQGKADLKSWTYEEIYQEILGAYENIWRQRNELGTRPITEISEYVVPNNFPKEVRGTLRDLLSYQIIEFLSNSSRWSPEQANELYKLKVEDLVKFNKPWDKSQKLSGLHPLMALAQVAADLEAWHADADRYDAQLSAHLERLEQVNSALQEPEARKILRTHLADYLDDFRKAPWWSMGMAQLAAYYEQNGEHKKARDTAREGRDAFKGTLGADRCQAMMARLEAPAYSITAMELDGLAQRSVMIEHKNLSQLYLRAYALSSAEQLKRTSEYQLLPSQEQIQNLVAAAKPVSSWTVSLPETPDLQMHRTFTTPPMQVHGLYVIVASVRDDFADRGNSLQAASIILSDLVMLSREPTPGAFEVSVVSGKSGASLPDVTLELYQVNWQGAHLLIDTVLSNAAGEATFKSQGERGRQFFVVAKTKGEVVINPRSFYFGSERSHASLLEKRSNALVYTDRSIYRPGQTIQWKVVAYTSDVANLKFQAAAEAKFDLKLLDANDQVVATQAVQTNRFGSASGEFVIPTGRSLGRWTLQRTKGSGGTTVLVEEYKRPTFEVLFADSSAPVRLNKDVTLQGTARYYFGQPVSSGKVHWRVTRQAIFPWWWSYFYGEETYSRSRPTRRGARYPARSQTIATGTSDVKSDGTFDVSFLPEADEKAKDAQSISYSYLVSADLTGENGETRTGTKTLSIGFVAVQARIEMDQGFAEDSSPAHINVTRTTLDGVAEASDASWSIVELTQPEAPQLPADEPQLTTPDDDAQPTDGEALRTPGDQQKPRWAANFNPSSAMSRWPEGKSVDRGSLKHGADGVAKLSLPKLPAGAYRFKYETKDKFGASYTNWHDFVVVSPKSKLNVPLSLSLAQSTVKVGNQVRIMIASGFQDQPLRFEILRPGQSPERRLLKGGSTQIVDLPVKESDRGGFAVAVTTVRDHQVVALQEQVFVPWDNKDLEVSFATFRDKLRPGTKETWRVTVKDAQKPKSATPPGLYEVLGSMYDRSLELFQMHTPPNLQAIFPRRTYVSPLLSNLAVSSGQSISRTRWFDLPSEPSLASDSLRFYEHRSIGGLGKRSMPAMMGTSYKMVAHSGALDAVSGDEQSSQPEREGTAGENPGQSANPAAPVNSLRSHFAETAFWLPQLRSDASGGVNLEFQVPDSVTEWNVWVHALSADLQSGIATQRARSLKELMVRPALPRFLREGDHAALKMVVDNSSERSIHAEVNIEILDPETSKSLAAEFGLAESTQTLDINAKSSATLSVDLTAPKGVRTVAVKVSAKSKDFADGELRALPILPSRVHLAESRFITLRDQDKRTMTFDAMARADDPSRIDEQLVVSLDGQLIFSLLKALPYLVEYPYESTEQWLNRFVSTGILSSVFKKHPAVAAMAKEYSARKTPLESWNAQDPNRQMRLEETPWLLESQGGGGEALHGKVARILDPKVAAKEQEQALSKLTKAQLSSGGFPWFPGGPASPAITLYLLNGFARAAEFGVPVPKDMIVRAWQYTAKLFRSDYLKLLNESKPCCFEILTYLNYIASAYPDSSWVGGALTEKERKDILNFSFKHWRLHSPYLKGYLALTLHRAKRSQEANLVFDSIMDSARADRDLGTYWQPEDRSWLWYQDSVESHAFVLRALTELQPKSVHRQGLAQWLFLNRKLNHWKSTRATAEALYALTHYLKSENSLGVREVVHVDVGGKRKDLVFEPSKFLGKTQISVSGADIDPKKHATTTVEKETKGFMFASTTWHFSTDRLPAMPSGDFFKVERRYFKRSASGKDFTLLPLAEGSSTVRVGDELEVHLSLSAKQAAEYVHLRDPRAAGFEPTTVVSGYRWDQGIGCYEETRDNGANFFFEQLPAGEYLFKYRLRATTAGTFRVGPATLQSIYAPEFAAYSAGNAVAIEP